jgi:hypothetical protein
VLYSSSISKPMVVVIDASVSAVSLGLLSSFVKPVQKRAHPISQDKIAMGRSIRIAALLRMRVFLGNFKTVPGLNFAWRGDKCY